MILNFSLCILTGTRSINVVRFTALTSFCRTENTPAFLVESGHARIDRHALNEAYFRAVPAANTFAQGMKTDVLKNYDGMWFPVVVAAGGPLSPAVATGEINFRLVLQFSGPSARLC